MSQKIALTGSHFDVVHGRGTRRMMEDHLGPEAHVALAALQLALIDGKPVVDPNLRDQLHLHGLVDEHGSVRNPIQAVAAVYTPPDPQNPILKR